MMDMACSYGFGVFPIACKLRLLKDTLPALTNRSEILLEERRKEEKVKQLLHEFTYNSCMSSHSYVSQS